MKLFKNLSIAVGILSCLGINESNASVKSIDGQNAASSFADILSASISGGKIQYHRYQKGQAVTPDQGLWRITCEKKCTAMNCGNESSILLSPNITKNGITMMANMPSSHYDGAICLQFCPKETIRFCAGAFRDNFAKKKTKEELDSFLKLTLGLVATQAANQATEKSHKGSGPLGDLYLIRDPAKIAEIQAAHKDNITKVGQAVKTLKG